MMSTYHKALPFLLKIINGLQEKGISQNRRTISITPCAVIVIDRLYCIRARQFIIFSAEQMKICEQRKALTGLCSVIDFYSPCFTEYA